MKENFLISAHDTTFSPTGLWNFVKGSELVDSSGNSKTLTEQDAPIDEVDFVPGEAEGLSHFSYYRICYNFCFIIIFSNYYYFIAVCLVH